MIYIYDTREHDGKNQHILDAWDKMGISYKKKKLDYGDYSFLVPANEDLDIPRDLDFSRQIVVERKASLDEFAGNCVKERERIKKEFTLAPPEKVLLIENASYSDMLNLITPQNLTGRRYIAFGTSMVSPSCLCRIRRRVRTLSEDISSIGCEIF